MHIKSTYANCKIPLSQQGYHPDPPYPISHICHVSLVCGVIVSDLNLSACGLEGLRIISSGFSSKFGHQLARPFCMTNLNCVEQLHMGASGMVDAGIM